MLCFMAKEIKRREHAAARKGCGIEEHRSLPHAPHAVLCAVFVKGDREKKKKAIRFQSAHTANSRCRPWEKHQAKSRSAALICKDFETMRRDMRKSHPNLRSLFR